MNPSFFLNIFIVVISPPSQPSEPLNDKCFLNRFTIYLLIFPLRSTNLECLLTLIFYFCIGCGLHRERIAYLIIIWYRPQSPWFCHIFVNSCIVYHPIQLISLAGRQLLTPLLLPCTMSQGEDVKELMKAVQCPQLIMPAGPDSPADQKGGENVKVGIFH